MQELFNKLIEFHGHLGPYIVLGWKIGNYALEKLNARKYFGLRVMVETPPKPQSCIADGLQVSTGATCGKMNFFVIPAPHIKIYVQNKETNEQIIIKLKDDLTQKINDLIEANGLDEASKEIYLMEIGELLKI